MGKIFFTEWCKIYGITTNTYYNRIKNGYSVIEAITIPKKGKKR